MSKVWLVTGCSRGLGRSIAETVLAAGERMVATARDPSSLEDLAERYGDQVRLTPLDVTDSAAAQAAVKVAVDAFGRLDVVVNNAGFGHIAPFEQMAGADFRAQIDTNLYGVVNVTRAALPVLRAQKTGHIIQISSAGGRFGMPGLSAYMSAKWAVGGFSEVLAAEVAPIGIKVTVVEPGGMRTDWGVQAEQDMPGLHPDYAPSMGEVMVLLEQHIGQETGDPAKVARVVLGLAHHDNPPVHLLLGSDAVQFVGQAEAARAASDARWRGISCSTDFAAPADIPEFPQQ